MKIEEGKVLVNTKIDELSNIVKNEEKDYKIDYLKKQILPKSVSALIVLIGEYFILNSDLSNEQKVVLNIPVAICTFVLYVLNLMYHEDYSFYSNNKNTLDKIKRIKKYLDNNINILDEVTVKDFEWYLNNINYNLQLYDNAKKVKKL